MKLINLFLLFALICLASCEPPAQMNKVQLGEWNSDDKNEGLSDEEWQRSMRDLSDGNRTIPSSSEVTSHIDSFLTPANDCYNYFNPSDSISNPASKGARTVLASFYQSCAAIDNVITSRVNTLKGVTSVRVADGKCGVKSRRIRKIYDRDAFIKSHIVLSKLDNDPSYPGPGCIDKRKAPPVYGYCSTTNVNSKGEAKLSQKGMGVAKSSLPASGIDCSAFISLALGSQGLKVSKTDDKFKRYTTTGFAGAAQSSKNSCLKSPVFSEEKSIIPGDIINYRASHVVMIDAVGEDPLGIDKFSKTSNCGAITIDAFDFTYIHSGLTGGNYGPSRVHVSAHNGSSSTMFNNLVQLARKACAKKVKGEKELGSASKLHSSNARFGLLRHQSDDPRCRTDKKVKIEGQSCIDQCVEKGS
ncbi:hypothetical protein [Halobacteriovorax sp. HLS]|uniref:hypothetical protein n=1 Tax=Halobacteriovorax sp. HLS TaxID=2234000 RepID=UPI000FDCCF17|nr:hypothetical protein [Halobacteriovorax sp. HLS]